MPLGQSEASLAVTLISLLLHPHVQRRAQAEIDAIVGRDRLPSFDDRASTGDSIRPLFSEYNNDGANEAVGDEESLRYSKLVYVEAVCRELLRWQNVTPLAVPHAVLKDDVYEGMFIPKGEMFHVPFHTTYSTS